MRNGTRSLACAAAAVAVGLVGCTLVQSDPAALAAKPVQTCRGNGAKACPSSTPSATTTSPSPTSSSTPTAPAVGQLCTNPYFTTSGTNSGVEDGGFYVHNNLWNAAKYPGTTGTLQVCSYRSWNHTAVASNASGTGEVKTYPNVHRNLSGRTIGSFATLDSTFAHTSPGNVGIYNVAYDFWINGIPNEEVMIWTDNYRQVPAGSRVATVTLSRISWDVYATADNHYIAFVPSGGARLTSAALDLRAFLLYLVTVGRHRASDTVDQIGYGIEIVDTGNVPRTWNITDYSLTAAPEL